MIDVQSLCDALKGGLSFNSDKASLNRFFKLVGPLASSMRIPWSAQPDMDVFEAGALIRASIVRKVEKSSEIWAHMISEGFTLPEDPIAFINELNSGRRLFESVVLTDDQSSSLSSSLNDFFSTVSSYDDGTFEGLRGYKSLQVSSFEVSVDGLGPLSGDPLADVLRFTPTDEILKIRAALQAVSELSFSRRKPYLLFTADFNDSSKSKDTTVCFMKMRDAGGYEVKKRDVFSSVDFPIQSFSNETLQASTDSLLADPNFKQLINFYDWVDQDDFYAFLDQGNDPDRLYSYTVSGVQDRSTAPLTLFDVKKTQVNLSAAQLAVFDSLMRAQSSSSFLDTTNDASFSRISPYPALSQVIYGDPGFGWIIAGCTFSRLSSNGTNNTDFTRAFSYISTSTILVMSSLGQGLISIPSDIDEVHSAVEQSISSFGVSQTILSILSGIGIMDFAREGTDDWSSDIRKSKQLPLQELLERSAGLLTRVIGAIDVESAIIDPDVISTSIASRSILSQKNRYTPGQVPTIGGTSVDVTKLDPTIGPGIIDLTTYEGISRLMKLIRAIFDFYPGTVS